MGWLAIPWYHYEDLRAIRYGPLSMISLVFCKNIQPVGRLQATSLDLKGIAASYSISFCSMTFRLQGTPTGGSQILKRTTVYHAPIVH